MAERKRLYTKRTASYSVFKISSATLAACVQARCVMLWKNIASTYQRIGNASLGGVGNGVGNLLGHDARQLTASLVAHNEDLVLLVRVGVCGNTCSTPNHAPATTIPARMASVARVYLVMVVLMPPHRPLSEVMGMVTLFFTSTPEGVDGTRALCTHNRTRQVTQELDKRGHHAARLLGGGLGEAHLGGCHHLHCLCNLLDVLDRLHTLLDCEKSGFDPCCSDTCTQPTYLLAGWQTERICPGWACAHVSCV